MTDSKARRQQALADIVRSGVGTSQDDLVRQLIGLGYSATQATVSRDLEQIGAVRVRRDGRLSYALPGGHPRDGSRLTAIFREFVRSVEPAGNLIVIKTPPGSAHLVGVVLDEASRPEIVGTICGDDTLFIACRDARSADSLAKEFESAIATI